MNLDKSKPYGEVYGHQIAKYEQNKQLFNGAGLPVGAPAPGAPEPVPQPTAKEKAKQAVVDKIVDTSEVSTAGTFLVNMLKEGPLSKSVLFKAADQSNQTWEDVQKASVVLNIVKYQFKNVETWKLPEELQP